MPRKPIKKKESPRDSFITRIEIQGLFGQFKYNLHPKDLHGGAHLLALYGDNGSGKTTILNLIFHLLSHEDKKGHRSFLAQTQFQKLCIHFGNGYQLTAEKPKGKLLGTFTMTLSKNQDIIARQRFEANEENIVPGTVPPDLQKQYTSFFQHQASLGLTVHLLSDNRKIRSDILVDEERHDLAGFTFADLYEGHLVRRKSHEVTEDLGLRNAMKRLLERLRQQTLLGNNTGVANVNTVYTDIIRRLATEQTGSRRTPGKAKVDKLIEILDDQAERSAAFSSYGLGSPIGTKALQKILMSAEPRSLSVIAKVLEPYTEAVTARLDALESVYDIISTFVKTINQFYTYKQLQFDLSKGINILTDQGEPLNPDFLSSGEKQLLLLFCNVISSGERPTVFIIDEPELSLNVKWQRAIINALLKLVENRPVQMLVATHSLELITQHRGCVARLDNLSTNNLDNGHSTSR